MIHFVTTAHIGKMDEKMCKIFFFIALAIINASIGSATEVAHPPTYEQMKKAFKKDDAPDIDLYEVLQYSSDDIQRLKKTGSINYIIAAASQLYGSEKISLLMEHLKSVQKNILGLSLLITTLLNEDEIRKTPPLEGLIQRLKELSPNNGYPYYLQAYYYARKGDLASCINYTKQAVQCAVFNNYEVKLSENSIAASMFLGYLKLAAQIHALVLQNDMFLYYKLAQYILENSPDNKANMLLCKEMGKRLKANSTTVIGDYLSIGIQKKAFEALKKYQKIEEDLCSLNELKKSIDVRTGCSDKISKTKDISKKRWEKYYEDLYEKSEKYAMEKLIAEYPVTITFNGELIDCAIRTMQ